MPETFITTLDQRKTVSSREVAEILGVSLRAVQKYARLNIIPGAFQPRGKRGGWRFHRDMLEEWWAKTKTAGLNMNLPPEKNGIRRRNRRKIQSSCC